MDHESLEIIEKATKERIVCRAYFAGEEDARIVHPYGIFRTQKDTFMIACWQESGYSSKSSGSAQGFRNFPVNDCERIELIGRKFIIARQFDPGASIYSQWVFHVPIDS